MRKWIFSGKDWETERGNARLGLTARLNLYQTGMLRAHFQKVRTPHSGSYLTPLLLSTFRPCPTRPLPVSHPSLFSPYAPSTQPSLTLTMVNIPPERLVL